MSNENGRRRAAWLIAAAVIGVTATTGARAEDVVVKLPTASVLSAKTARSAKVAQLKAGDKLQVVGHEGSWLKVKVGDKEGYVHENSVGGKEGEGLSGLGKMLGQASGASEASSAEAGRGLGESAKWAQSKGMNASGLRRMIAIRNSVGEADWQKFAGEAKDGGK